MFGGHVGNRAQSYPLACEMSVLGRGAESCHCLFSSARAPALWQKFRQAKIEKLYLPAIGEENIGWLDVAVNDGFGVGCFEGIRHLVAVFWHALEFDGFSHNPVFKGLPFEKLHDDEALTLILVHVINRADVRMV